MSVTIHQSPQGFTPSDNPVVWTFSSDQTAQPNFSFLVEVYINGNLDSQNGPIFPSSGINVWFDAHEITSRSCTPPVVTDEPVDDAENYCEVYIKVIERYGSPVTSHADATSSTVKTWKAKLTNEDFEAYDQTDYVMGSATTVMFATQFPSGINPKIRVDETHRLMLLSNGDIITDVEYELYDSDDVNIVTASVSGTFNNPISILNVSPGVIIDETAITLAQFEAAAYYKINVYATTATVTPYRIDMNQGKRFSTGKRLHTLTKIGCIEGFSFDLIARKSSQVESASYQKKFGYIEGQDFIFDTNKGTEVDIAKIETKSMSLESDWLEETEQHWLIENFYTSPAVYLENSNGTLRLVKITNTAFAPGIQENDMLIAEKVDIILGTETSMIL